MARMSRRGIPVLKGGISDTKEERENGSGHKYKNAKYKNAKEEEKRNGLSQNTANTTAQKYNIEKHKGWREKTN